MVAVPAIPVGMVTVIPITMGMVTAAMGMVSPVMLAPITMCLAVWMMVVPVTRRRVIAMHRAMIMMMHDPAIVMVARDRGADRHAQQATQQGVFRMGLCCTRYQKSRCQNATYQDLIHNLLLVLH